MREISSEHVRKGSPGGIHAGAGNLRTEQLHELHEIERMKPRGVPSVVYALKKGYWFEHIKTLRFTVSEDHAPEQDAVFVNINKEMGEAYRPSVSLKPGHKVRLCLYRTHGNPTLNDCILFVKRERGLLAGTEGLLLSWTERGDELPTDLWILSLDEENLLPKDANGNPRVMGIFKSSAPAIGTERYMARMDGSISNKNCIMVLSYDDEDA